MLIDIDDSKFGKLPRKKILSEENIVQMLRNLWSMFELKCSVDEVVKLRKSGVSSFGLNVSDYAWTEKVKRDFYNHPYHRELVEALKDDGMSWGLWVISCEPCDVCDIKKHKKK